MPPLNRDDRKLNQSDNLSNMLIAVLLYLKFTSHPELTWFEVGIPFWLIPLSFFISEVILVLLEGFYKGLFRK